jgi:hypothetical protein
VGGWEESEMSEMNCLSPSGETPDDVARDRVIYYTQS